MTDNKGVKLTAQEALNNEDVGRNIATLPWRVIDRRILSGRGVIGIEDLNTACTITYPSQGTVFIHINGYTRHAAGGGTREAVIL
ncbi:MAG: hypothetical protein ABR999_03035 [Methanoregula sp.]|jgi:hypothetical protein|uniref:hypothetical protein n=1 Tax=Methanoregula sp. TaxID=2052170 RepID=UPI003D14E715